MKVWAIGKEQELADEDGVRCIDCYLLYVGLTEDHIEIHVEILIEDHHFEVVVVGDEPELEDEDGVKYVLMIATIFMQVLLSIILRSTLRFSIKIIIWKCGQLVRNQN